MSNMEHLDKTISIDTYYGKRLAKIVKSGSNYLNVDGKAYPLITRKTIGRGDANYIIIDDKLASLRHAELHKIKDDFLIKDLQSKNGTYVNDEQVPPGKYLKIKAGDVVRIGSTEIAVK